MTSSAFIAPILLAAGTLAATPLATAEAWNVDASHTEINFSVRHFFTPVTGSFKEFDIDLQYDRANPSNSTVSVTIDVASIDTGNADRDQHLMSGDFFEAETHPRITFRSTSVRANGQDGLIATGPLTIKGVSREVQLSPINPWLGHPKENFPLGTAGDAWEETRSTRWRWGLLTPGGDRDCFSHSGRRRTSFFLFSAGGCG